MLEHNSHLDIYSKAASGALRNTGIVCTIGPKTQATEKLTMLRSCGMNVLRMNFSHGSYEEHGLRVTNLRESMKVLPLRWSSPLVIPAIPSCYSPAA